LLPKTPKPRLIIIKMNFFSDKPKNYEKSV